LIGLKLLKILRAYWSDESTNTGGDPKGAVTLINCPVEWIVYDVQALIHCPEGK